MDKKYIYESPDKGKTVYRREFGKTDRELYHKRDTYLYTEYDHYIEKMIEHDTNRTCWNDRMKYWGDYSKNV
jgi:hypothetical protein